MVSFLANGSSLGSVWRTYSISLETRAACSSPKYTWTKWNVKSKPEVTPEELQMGGSREVSSTQRACGIHVVFGPKPITLGQDVLLVVA
jgi:hypothetical protein